LKLRQVEQKKKDQDLKRQLEENQIQNHRKMLEKMQEIEKKESLIKDNLVKLRQEKLKHAETKAIMISQKVKKTIEYNEKHIYDLRHSYEDKKVQMDKIKYKFELYKKKQYDDRQIKIKQKETEIRNNQVIKLKNCLCMFNNFIIIRPGKERKGKERRGKERRYLHQYNRY